MGMEQMRMRSFLHRGFSPVMSGSVRKLALAFNY